MNGALESQLAREPVFLVPQWIFSKTERKRTATGPGSGPRGVCPGGVPVTDHHDLGIRSSEPSEESNVGVMPELEPTVFTMSTTYVPGN